MSTLRCITRYKNGLMVWLASQNKREQKDQDNKQDNKNCVS